jgi:hypothetical protein
MHDQHAWQYGGASAPPEPIRQQRAYLLDTFQRGVAGYPTDDRVLQSQKFGGYVYLAVMPLMRAVRAADVVALRRKPLKGKVTFGPGGSVAKSMSAAYGKSARPDYRPLDEDHPVARVIARPQGKDGPETIGDVMEYASLQGRLTGARVLWGVPSEKYLDGGEWRPVQLYALPTALCIPRTTSASPQYPKGLYQIQPYYATPTGSAGWFPGRAGGIAGTTLDGREIYRALYKHPLVKWDGWSPQTACRFSLDVAEAVDESRWAAMNHGTTPDIMVTLSGADQHSLDTIQQQFKQGHGGSKNARKVMVLGTPTDQGKIDVKTPFLAAREMDYVGSWEQAVGAVLAAFGTPKTVAMLGESEAYATWYAARRQFQDSTVVPECRELSDLMTRTLGEPWSEEAGEICVEVIPQPVENEEAERDLTFKELDAGVITVNQYLAKRNLPRQPDGDAPLAVWLSKQQIAAGTAPDPTKPPPVPPGKPGDTPTGGAPPRPENPDGEDTRPPTGPRGKSMSSLVDSAGGALVAPATVGVRPRKRRVFRGKAAERLLTRIVKGDQ